MLFHFPGWLQPHRWINRLILSFDEVPHGEHPCSLWWLFCILSFTSFITAAHFPVGFMEKVILAVSLPKPSFPLLPILSPQKAFIKVTQTHDTSMFVWIHACMHIHGTFTFDKYSSKQNFSHMGALKQINMIITIMEIVFSWIWKEILAGMIAFCWATVNTNVFAIWWKLKAMSKLSSWSSINIQTS